MLFAGVLKECLQRLEFFIDKKVAYRPSTEAPNIWFCSVRG